MKKNINIQMIIHYQKNTQIQKKIIIKKTNNQKKIKINSILRAKNESS